MTTSGCRPISASGTRRAAVTLLAIAAAAPLGALAQSDFERCVADLQSRAVAQGVSSATATDVLAGVQELERVVAADRSQAEFVETFYEYLSRRATPQRIALGRRLYAEHRELLTELTARSGVPGQYLVAFWGLETNYGSVLGNVPVFDSLATLACDRRRSDYFASELISALKIVDRGDVPATTMIGSWAGAMGQTQFMPSTYLEHAVDGDRDGAVDLWRSVPDALSSAAHLLGSLGWQRGVRWGREVLLPEGFDYTLAGLEQRRTLDEWRDLGLRETNGALLPGSATISGSLLVPAGHRGPVFIVYENFRVIMRWNRSEFFALAIGHLADRIAGAGALAAPPPANDERLRREDLIALQQALAERGYYEGAADGIIGPATRGAIRGFQRATGAIADGFPSPELLLGLGIAP